MTISISRWKTPYNLLVDNFNRWAMIPEGAGDEFISEFRGVETKFSSRLRYNYMTSKDIKEIYNSGIGKKFQIDGINLFTGSGQAQMGLLRDYYNSLTPENQVALNKIGFLDDFIVGSDAEVSVAVVAVGGFLGVGARMVAVPASLFESNDKGQTVLPKATKDVLIALPEFRYAK